MNTRTTMLYYMNGEIITCSNGIRYSCPPAKVVVTNTSATFDELETNICQSFSIDRMQTQLKMNFMYPIFGANGISNYIQIPIKDDDDVRGMFIAVAQASPAVTIEMYLETFPIDHHVMSIGCSQREQIVKESMSSMGYDRMSSPLDCHTYDEDVETIMNSEMVIESVMLMAEIFVDIPVQNDDVDEDEPIENYSSLLGGEYEVPSPLYKELNWDVINVMSDETLTSRDGLWNELYEGLQFENKADLHYVVKRYSIHRNQHFVVCEFDPNLWMVKCKKSINGCKWRLCACHRKTHCMFEITKYIGHHTCAYPKLSQDHSQLDSTLIAREIQSIVKRDPTTSIATLHQILKDKFGYNVHYMRVWEARRTTVEKVFGEGVW